MIAAALKVDCRRAPSSTNASPRCIAESALERARTGITFRHVFDGERFTAFPSDAGIAPRFGRFPSELLAQTRVVDAPDRELVGAAVRTEIGRCESLVARCQDRFGGQPEFGA